MIKYYKGTVFNSGAQAMVNTINTIGFMGAGIALEFRLRYPEMYIDYEKKCEEKKLKIGKVDYFQDKSGVMIVNFPTKAHFKYPSRMEWIEKGLQNFTETYEKYGIKSIAFPKLGANHGGLKWEEVKIVMEKYLFPLDIEIIICLDELKEAEGIEKEMLNRFNEIDIDSLAKKVRLTKKQKEIIENSRPLDRFWKISKLESIGVKTYENLFKYFYNIDDIKEPSIGQQQSLFDYL